MKTKKIIAAIATSSMFVFLQMGASAQNVFPSTGKAGIGTTTPTENLEVVTTGGNSYVKIRSVGTSTAPYTTAGLKIGATGVLSIASFPAYGSGTLNIDNGNGMVDITGSSINLGGLPGPGYGAGKINLTGQAWANSFVVSDYPAPGQYQWGPPSGFKAVVNGKSYFSDYVGIGVSCIPTDANVKLGVKGKVLCEELKIQLENGTCWADYVFDKNYNLQPLSEVEKYIQENKHLTEVPSAAEVASNGLEVSDMLKLQMQKIEELTLYMIEMKKEIEALKKENQELKSNR